MHRMSFTKIIVEFNLQSVEFQISFYTLICSSYYISIGDHKNSIDAFIPETWSFTYISRSQSCRLEYKLEGVEECKAKH